MVSMFAVASAFNRDIGGWAVENVRSMWGMFYEAAAFDQDLGGWAVDSVTDMSYMFRDASAFNQDLGWCVADKVRLPLAFYGTPCSSTSCGVMAKENPGDCDVASTGNVMVNWKIKQAVAAWLSDSAAAEAAYGHISTWETGGVTDMSALFCAYGCGSDSNSAAASFNEDIGAWDTSGVTSMRMMFHYAAAFNQDIGGWQVGNVEDMEALFDRASSFNQPIGGWSIEAVKIMKRMFLGASAFDQDLGWCVGKSAKLSKSFFDRTKCKSTSCGVAQKDEIGICEPWARPCLIVGGPSQCIINSPTLIIAIVLLLLAGFGACVCCRKEKPLWGCLCCCCFCCRKKTEPRSVDSRPDSLAKSPSGEPDEEATAPESLDPPPHSRKTYS